MQKLEMKKILLYITEQKSLISLQEYINEAINDNSSTKFDIAPETQEKSLNYFKQNIAKLDNIDELFNIVYGANLNDKPFRYSSSAVKLARVYQANDEFMQNLANLLNNINTTKGTDKNKITAYGFTIEGITIKFGNGSIDRISTRNQEQGTCDVWNQYINKLKDKTIENIEDELLNIISTLTYDNEKKHFQKEWQNSFYNQIKQILLVCEKREINNITDYKLVRRGNEIVGKAYEKFVKKYTDVVSNGQGKIDNYDPTDVILYIGDEKELATKLDNLCEQIGKDNASAIKDSYIKDLFNTNICIGISLKKIYGSKGKAGKYELMNMNDDDNKIETKVNSFKVEEQNDKTKNTQVKVKCYGTFNLAGYTDPNDGNSIDKEPPFLLLTLRSFDIKGDNNQVGMDIQLNAKLPSLGKVPKRIWAEKLFNIIKPNKENNLSKPVKPIKPTSKKEMDVYNNELKTYKVELDKYNNELKTYNDEYNKALKKYNDAYISTYKLIDCVTAFNELLNSKDIKYKDKCKILKEFIDAGMKTSSSCFPYILIH